jgi:hypothetical protein
VEFRFDSFEQFYAEVGDRPAPGYWLKRISSGHIEPGNLEWVPKKQRRKRQRLRSAATIISGPAFLRQERVYVCPKRVRANVNLQG